jgi:hypothetical protein
MKISFLVFLTILFITNLVHDSSAQSIKVSEDVKVRIMLDTRKELNFKKNRFIKAWSIQLLVTRDKYEVVEKQEEAIDKFKDVKIDWSYEQPYYRLESGAYYTKLEASMALQKFREVYPDAYVIKKSNARASDF